MGVFSLLLRGVANPVVGVAKVDVRSAEDAGDEIDEVLVENELVEKHILVWKIRPRFIGGITLEPGEGRQLLADCCGDSGSLLLRVEVLDGDVALPVKGFEMCIG